MNELTLTPGSQDVTTNVMLYDDTTGAPKTGLAYDTSGLVLSYVRAAAARTAVTAVTQTAAGAHDAGGFVEIDATNCPGLYRVDWPDAAFLTGVNHVSLVVKCTDVITKTITAGLTYPAYFSSLSIDANGRGDVSKIEGSDATDQLDASVVNNRTQYGRNM